MRQHGMIGMLDEEATSRQLASQDGMGLSRYKTDYNPERKRRLDRAIRQGKRRGIIEYRYKDGDKE